MSDERRIGVRELAVFALRRGDLERAPAGPSAREGQLAHQRAQQRSAHEPEVTLSRTLVLDGRSLVLSGRLDLLDRDAHRLIEIKSTLVPRERLLPGRCALDRSQLALYGWLWCGRDEADPACDPVPTLELRYVNLRSGRTTSERWQPDPATDERMAHDALRAWLRHCDRRDARRAALARSAATLAFPHAGFRAGQRRLSIATYRAVRDGEPLLLEAPTGTGKSLGVLYPAIRALGEGHARTVCWLTAKNSGREPIHDALRRLVAGGLIVDAVQVRARRQSCFCERDPAHRDEDGTCPFATGFHDRLPQARAAALGAGEVARLLDGECVDRIALEHRVCPHALTLELLPEASLVICDLNHRFDPLSTLPSLVEGADSSIVLIDEAHNLPARARSMYSACLSRLDCLDARASCLIEHPSLASALDALARALRGQARTMLPPTDLAPSRKDASPDGIPDALCKAVARVLDAHADIGAASIAHAGPLDREFVLTLHRFNVIAERFGSAHRLLLDESVRGRRREVLVRLACLDAREFTAAVLRSIHSSVLFSAALGPLPVFRDALGLDADASALAMPSPFDPNRLHCQLIDWLPMRFAERDASLPALIALIAQTVAARTGHYLVFLPSHAWLARVADAFERQRPDLEGWRQEAGCGPATVRQRLERLERAGTTVGFVITGGVYGEGIDYAGDRLIGAFVVGTGLPAPDRVATLMIDHHRAAKRPGYDLVCRYPALIRVLQSAGRVIRTATDRGVLLLIDPRFAEPFYRRECPSSWRPCRPVDAADSHAALTRFWALDATTPDVPEGTPGVTTIQRIAEPG